MAEIDIACPNCGNQRSVSDDLAGKKIKCMKCQTVFTVKGPPPKPAAKPAAKPAPAPAKPAVRVAKPIKPKDEEDENPNPYTMVEENLAARCPFCAMLLDPPDALICLHCGYHMEKRRRVESKQTYERTAGDYFIWHLPTIGCFIAVLVLIGIDVYCLMHMSGWVHDWDIEELVPAGCFSTWIVVISMLFIFLAGRLVFRRLVYRFAPPEKEVKGGLDEAAD
jgi:predicted Zn finger-like uncharacterized protein